MNNIRQLLDTCIFCPAEVSGPLFIAAVAWLSINLHELVKYANRENISLPDTQKYDMGNQSIESWTSALRSQMVHPGSEIRLVEYPEAIRRGGIIIGVGPIDVKIAGQRILCPEGDMYLSGGRQNILIKSQIIALANDLLELLAAAGHVQLR